MRIPGDAVEWWFQTQRASDKHRDPTQGEYFHTDANSVVREAIQNSLDASLEDGPVRVAIRIDEKGRPVDDAMMRLFDGLKPHLAGAAETARVPPDLPETCRVLLIEDFGTTGLRGDPNKPFPDDDEDHGFYHFFRAEGRSSKQTGARGSWGVGKFTFVKASEINTFFGITVPDDGEVPSALGEAVLTNHRVGGKHYEPDGWWGKLVGEGDEQMVTSFRPNDHAYAFVRDQFRIERSLDETGLSIAVPFLSPEIDRAGIERAVLENYLPSLILGHLCVEIFSEDDRVLLDATTASERVQRLREDNGEIRALLRLACRIADDPMLVLRNRATSHSWTDYEMEAEDARAIQDWEAAGEPFTVRIPIRIESKDPGRTHDTHFDMSYDPAEKGARPVFFRAGIRVTDAALRQVRQAHCLVWVGDPPLAEMLGLAESPAHSTWDSSSDRFKGRYVQGRGWISFVRNAPTRLIETATAGQQTEDLRAFASFFPRVASDGPRRSRAEASVPGEGESHEVDVTTRSMGPPIEILPYKHNGIRVRSNDLHAGDELTIVAAYDLVRGNPFANWSELDFDLADLVVDLEHAVVIAQSGQELRVRVSGPDANIRIKGFDRWLDVIVRCEVAR